LDSERVLPPWFFCERDLLKTNANDAQNRVKKSKSKIIVDKES